MSERKSELPKKVDLSRKVRIRDQGQLGSSTSFGVGAAIEQKCKTKLTPIKTYYIVSKK